jgi:hypothetical protein
MLGMPIEVVSRAHWLEIASWICQIILTFLAIAAAIFTYIQIQQIREDSAQQLKISHANLLMDIDHRWDHEMKEARNTLALIADDIQRWVKSRHPGLEGADLNTEIQSEWRRTLNGMRRRGSPAYLDAISICGFFETVGLMVRKNYVSADDVVELLGVSILNLDFYLRPHIEERAKEEGVPEGFFEHALHLCDLANTS